MLVNILKIVVELFWYRKNGKVVGTVAKDVKGPLFPTVAVHSQNEEYVAAFGFSLYALAFFICIFQLLD